MPTRQTEGTLGNISLSIFILSWPGFEERTLEIEKSLAMLKHPITVLYNPAPEAVRPVYKRWKIFAPESRFGSKFEFAITSHRPQVYLFIAADTDADSWANLVEACISAFSNNNNIGVWTPKIDNSYWKLRITQIGVAQAHDDLVEVISTDSIVWAISKNIRDRLVKLDYSNSVFGWGIDVVSAAFAHTMNLRVVCDTSISVNHRKTTTYSVPVADEESHAFYSQLAKPVDTIRRIIEQYAESKYLLSGSSSFEKLRRRAKEIVDWVYKHVKAAWRT